MMRKPRVKSDCDQALVMWQVSWFLFSGTFPLSLVGDLTFWGRERALGPERELAVRPSVTTPEVCHGGQPA